MCACTQYEHHSHSPSQFTVHPICRVWAAPQVYIEINPRG